MTTFRDIATPWRRLGANVIPAKSREKTPLVGGWGKDGTCWHSAGGQKQTDEEFEDLCERFGDTDCGLVFPGSLNCLVIDVDDPSMVEQVLRVVGHTDHRTISGRDGGGVHLWYDGVERSKNGAAPKVDIKSNGGYVVAPESIHATGRPYLGSLELLAWRDGTGPRPPEPKPGWQERLARLGKVATRIELGAYADRLRKARKTTLARILYTVARGEAFDEGARDESIFQALSLIANEWPYTPASQISALFADTLRAIDDPEFDDAVVLEKWARLSDEVDAELEEQSERAREATRTVWSWTDAPEYEWGPLGSDDLDVLRYGKNYYTRVKNYFVGPWMRDSLDAAYLRDIELAFGVVARNKQGDLSLPALLTEKGKTVKAVRTSLVVPQTTYDESTNELVIAAGPRRFLTPELDGQVHEAFVALFGEYIEQFYQWAIGLLRPEQPLRALVLSGTKGVGKTLLTNGIARLWRQGAVDAHDVLGKRFNGSAMNSPFVVSDDAETNPTEMGEQIVAFLRQAVTSRKQRVERKYHEVESLEGAMRYVFLTNDAFAMMRGAVGHQYNTESVEAFADRVCHIPARTEAEGWWHRICGEDPHDPRGLVEGDRIARHILAVFEGSRHKAVAVDRFWVGPADTDLGRFASVSTGLRGDVLVELGSALDGGKRIGVRVDHDARGNERVIANTRGFVGAWDPVGKPRGVSLRTVGGALKALSEASVCIPIKPLPGELVEHAIDGELVRWYCHRVGL